MRGRAVAQRRGDALAAARLDLVGKVLKRLDLLFIALLAKFGWRRVEEAAAHSCAEDDAVRELFGELERLLAVDAFERAGAQLGREREVQVGIALHERLDDGRVLLPLAAHEDAGAHLTRRERSK